MSAEIKILIDAYTQADSLKSANSELEKMLLHLQNISKAQNNKVKSTNNVSEITKEINEQKKVTVEIEKKKAAVVALTIEEQKNKNSIAEKNRMSKIEAQLASATKGSYAALSAELAKVTVAFRKINLESKTVSKSELETINRRKQLIDQLKKIDATQGVHTRNVGNYASALGGLKERFTGLMVGMAAFAGTFAFLKKGWDSFLEAEKNAKQLAFALKNVGGEGEIAFKGLIEQSENLQKNGIFSDDAIQQAQLQLANYGLSSKAIEDLIPMITDMAAATGKDLGDATSIVIKGINGQTKGLKMLGIDYKSTGDKAQDLALMTEQLTKFQGANAAQMDTVAGKTERLKNVWDDLMENVGEGLVNQGSLWLDFFDILTGKLSLTEKFLGDVNSGVQDAFSVETQKYIKGLTGTIEEQTAAIDSQIKKRKENAQQASKDLDAGKISSQEFVMFVEGLNKQIVDLESAKKTLAKPLITTIETEDDGAALTTTKKHIEDLWSLRLRLMDEGREKELLASEIAFKKEYENEELTLKEKTLLIEIYNKEEADINKKYDDEELAAKEKHYQALYDAEVLHQQAILDAKLDVQTRTKKLESDIAPEQTDFEKEMDRYRKQGQELNDLADQAQEQGIFDQARYDEDLQKLEDKHQLELKKIKDEADKQAKEDRKTSQNAQIDEITQFLDTIAGLEQKRSDDKIAQINRQITAQDEAITQQEIRAAQGLSNTLAFEEDKRRQLEMAAIQEEKRQEKLKKLEAFYNLFSEFAKTDPDSAALKAAEQVFVAEGLSLAFAEKGGIGEDIRDTTSLVNGQFDKSHGSGDMLTMISPKEGILTEQNVAALGGKDGFYNLKSMLENPIPDDIFARQNDSFANSFITTPLVNLDPMLKKLESLENAVRNIQTTEWNVDGFGNLIHTKTSQNSRVTTNKGVFIKPARKKTID